MISDTIMMPLLNNAGVRVGWVFWCPGCKCAHQVDDRWEFNGNGHRPTIRPSIAVTSESEKGNKHVCHSFVTDGRIKFLDDSTHELAGQEVELEKWSNR